MDKEMKMIEKLTEYAKLEGSELGESIQYLIALPRYDYCFSENFNAAVEKVMEEDKIDMAAAMQKVAKDQPELYKAYNG